MKKWNKSKIPLREQKIELLRILRDHDVIGIRKFILRNSNHFPLVTDWQIGNDEYLFDLLHVYKANLFYMGAQYFESMRYCLDKGLIKMSTEAKLMFDQAEFNQEEIASCAITPELVAEKLPR